MRAQKFVPQITMAMLHVHKIESQLPCHSRRAMEVLNSPAHVAVAKYRIVRGQIQATVQNRVTIQDSRLRLPVRVWPAITAGVRQLQPDEEARIRSRNFLVLLDEHRTQPRHSFAR